MPGFTESNPLDLYDMPYSHGLVATVVWSVGLALLWRALRRGASYRGEALIVGLAVASHFVLDLVVHVPDLPVVGTHGRDVGLGLWRHRELALVVECGPFVAAALVWRRPRDDRHPAPPSCSGRSPVLVASFYVPHRRRRPRWPSPGSRRTRLRVRGVVGPQPRVSVSRPACAKS